MAFKKWLTSKIKNVKYQFAAAFLFMVLASLPVKRYNDELRTPATPGKILALEFAFNDSCANQIKREWASKHVIISSAQIPECESNASPNGRGDLLTGAAIKSGAYIKFTDSVMYIYK